MGGVFFIACGSDSGSSSIDLDDSFDIILEKAQYEYDSKDSTLIIKKPVCKVGELGNLVWREESSDSTLKRIAYLEKKSALLFEKNITEPQSFNFDGGKFPVGFWSMSSEKSNKFQMGYRFEKGDDLNKVMHYSGECYTQDFKANLFEGKTGIAKTETALLDFYKKFLPSEKAENLDTTSVLKNINAKDCDNLTLFDDLVSIEIDDLDNSSGELTVSYESEECPIKFEFRYAMEEEDCNSAYEEFKADKRAENFDFNDYNIKIEYNEYCLERLVLQMKEDQNISLKKSTSLKIEGKNFAKGIIDILLSEMK